MNTYDIEEDKENDDSHFDITFSEYKKIKEISLNPHNIEKDVKCWYNLNNEYHRDEDLPARIFESNGDNSECGFLEWYQHGKLHRDNNKPAIVWDYGCEWWVNGVRHREDGPAVHESPGTLTKKWFLNGVEYTEDAFNALKEKEQLDQTINEKQKTSIKIKL
jgi:hypothetical protein